MRNSELLNSPSPTWEGVGERGERLPLYYSAMSAERRAALRAALAGLASRPLRPAGPLHQTEIPRWPARRGVGLVPQAQVFPVCATGVRGANR